MKSRNRILQLSLLAIVPLAASPAWASVDANLPPAKTVGPITYVSGGGNPAQAKAMNSAASAYPLELDFFWGRGQKETPVSGVDWSVRNGSGRELVNAPRSGPEVLASLPNGRYTVTAQYDQTSLSRNVTVHKGEHDRVVLEWPS